MQGQLLHGAKVVEPLREVNAESGSRRT